jgi:hypothetical protein
MSSYGSAHSESLKSPWTYLLTFFSHYGAKLLEILLNFLLKTVDLFVNSWKIFHYGPSQFFWNSVFFYFKMNSWSKSKVANPRKFCGPILDWNSVVFLYFWCFLLNFGQNAAQKVNIFGNFPKCGRFGLATPGLKAHRFLNSICPKKLKDM